MASAHGIVSTTSDAQRSSEIADDAEPECIESILDAIVIHNDKPIENIPSIAAPELKLIGRCVTFIGDTLIQGEMKPMHYEGLVATITHDTVMLIYVFRYTPENYETHVQNHSDYGESAKQFILSLPGNKAHLVSLGIYTEESVPSANACNSESSNCTQSQPQPQMYDQHLEDDDASMRCVLHNMNTSTHIGGERDSTQDINSEASITSQSRNRFLNITGSIGPIPYMTFTRTHIHSVKFAHDPQSNFYSLFRNPDKRFFDLQCLRMFVRRYVIHTSQENNPRKASLQSFLTHRCNCTYINEELLHGMVREEVAHLMKIDRDMKRAQCTLARHNRDAYLNYRAPAGLFRRTGILYLTGLPRLTFVIGIAQIVSALGLLLFYSLTTSLRQTYWVTSYIPTIVLSIPCSVVSQALLGIVSILQAMRISYPSNPAEIFSCLRSLMSVFCLCIMIFTFISIARCMGSGAVSQYVLGLSRLERNIIRDMYNCSFSSYEDQFQDSEPAASKTIRIPCIDIMIILIHRMYFPILCMLILSMGLVVMNIFYHKKLVRVFTMLPALFSAA